MRLAKTRISTATIRPIPELGATRVEFPYLNKGWRAGQHVRVQVLSSAMGLTGWAETHPFTVASQSNSKEGLVLLCKKTGTWTQNLFGIATKSRAEWGIGRNIRVIVEGPYGAFCWRFLHLLPLSEPFKVDPVSQYSAATLLLFSLLEEAGSPLPSAQFKSLSSKICRVKVEYES